MPIVHSNFSLDWQLAFSFPTFEYHWCYSQDSKIIPQHSTSQCRWEGLQLVASNQQQKIDCMYVCLPQTDFLAYTYVVWRNRIFSVLKGDQILSLFLFHLVFTIQIVLSSFILQPPSFSSTSAVLDKPQVLGQLPQFGSPVLSKTRPVWKIVLPFGR